MTTSKVKLAGSKSKMASKIKMGGDDFDEWKRARQLLKPPDQLVLSSEEMKEEFTRLLSSQNLQQPDNIVEFNYAQGNFIAKPLPGNTVVLLNMGGTRLHKESDEAKRQIAEIGYEDEDWVEEQMISEVGTETIPEYEEGDGEEEEEGEGEEGEGGEDEERKEGEEEAADEAEKEKEEDEELPKPGPKKKLTNMFNFCERAALTYNNPFRTQETQSIPPDIITFTGQVFQWVIFDAYDADFKAQQLEKEKEKKVIIPIKKVTTAKRKKFSAEDAMEARKLLAAKILERMVNLNSFDDIAKDYRYFEDPADEYTNGIGTVLPLWRFIYAKTRKSTVTDLDWNPYYYDLFAVCFGTLNFAQRRWLPGALCLFSIKNPSYPEYICLSECSVMCCDIHPKYPFVCVIGLYDGNVAVYNVQVSCKQPQYSSTTDNKHLGIVWKVKWGLDLKDGEMNFYSISSDGKINNWLLRQNALSLTTISTLILDADRVAGPDGTFIKLKGSATCMMFHPTNPLVYLIGTEEGLIYKCSTLYCSTYLYTYKAHDMPVYRVDYNKYDSSIFVSCSGDWRVKIWEDNRPEPLFVFDLGAQVQAVKWAPYSSTVFAAVTAKGRVFIFDLNVNKYKAICRQNLVSKKKNQLTRLCFNKKMPILIVGDDKGCVHLVKLSPNLRIMCKAPKKQQHLDQHTLQCMKLEAILALYREPPVLLRPLDEEQKDD